ncbi:hypothetical protein M0R04_15700 [Candidatus Dojkabacteria bacterium]|jgi:hypothetical protein|nr:hypothetical protein [Candidatus Dojkabacteria bacterium]
MEKKYYWLIFLVFGIALFVIALASHNYFYDMNYTNCKSITGTFAVSTEDYVSCQKFYNYPFWNFEFPYWLIVGFIHLLIGVAIFIIGAIICGDDDLY